MKLWEALRGPRNLARGKMLTDPDFFNFGGMRYPIFTGNVGSGRDEIDTSFSGYLNGAYKKNGPVFAVVLARMMLFTEARFLYQRMRNGRGGDLFSTRDLQLLETPWRGGTTGDLLTRAEQDVSLGGTFYAVKEFDPAWGRPRLRRLRPDWTQVILTQDPTLATQADIAGIMYTPGGGRTFPGEPSGKAQFYLPEEFVQWAPIPDPDAQFIGMSWIQSVLTEIYADKAATEHKARFFESGASPAYVASFSESVTPAEFEEFMEIFDRRAESRSAYDTFYLAGGAKISTVGTDLHQLDFKTTQGAGETRIAAAGGVPAIIVGLSEGLESATYSNYAMARRKFGDHWARPQWRSFCAAISHLVNTPPDARLWYDDRDIPFLREDAKDLAEIRQIQVSMIANLITQGFEPAAVVHAVMNDDLASLETAHSGLYSVQLQSLEQIQAAAESAAAASAAPAAESAARDAVERMVAEMIERYEPRAITA